MPKLNECPQGQPPVFAESGPYGRWLDIQIEAIAASLEQKAEGSLSGAVSRLTNLVSLIEAKTVLREFIATKEERHAPR